MSYELLKSDPNLNLIYHKRRAYQRLQLTKEKSKDQFLYSIHFGDGVGKQSTSDSWERKLSRVLIMLAHFSCHPDFFSSVVTFQIKWTKPPSCLCEMLTVAHSKRHLYWKCLWFPEWWGKNLSKAHWTVSGRMMKFILNICEGCYLPTGHNFRKSNPN